MRSLLILQIGLVLAGTLGFYLYLDSLGAVWASLFGGAVAIANSYLLARRLENAAAMAEENPDGGVLTLYLGVIQRFFFVVIMFVLGLTVFKFIPHAMLGVFALVQVAYLVFGSMQVK
ncbi:MAG: ATP synthase subunit I [Thiotrichaceae bacterium]|nr:ATP synthase subunit I [Thiotrichaceae bacterium]